MQGFRRWGLGAAGALAVILAVTGALWSRTRVQPLTAFDQHFYLGIAQDLRADGVFTDGFAFDGRPDGARPPGMRFAPLYPMLLAGVASVDPGLRAGMACLTATRNGDAACPARAPVMRGLQFAELAAVLLMVWLIGRALGGAALAWPALAAALITTPLLLRSVNYLMTEMTALFLTTAATWCALLALRPGRARLAAALAAGLLLAGAALTRPAFLYALPALLAGMAVAARPIPRGRMAAVTAGLAAGLAPWIARNALVMGRPALTFGYDSHTLVQRIAFDTMNGREYALAYLCWLPDGTSLGRRFVGPDACGRFGWDEHPNSFYVLGLRHMLPETLAASGGYAHHLGYLLRHYVLAMPLWHLAVSVPLALRGAYVAHWWGFVLLPLALACSWAALRGRRGYAVVALPAWFMLAFNAMVAVNQVRYNLMLIVPYALAAGMAAVALAARLRGRGRA